MEYTDILTINEPQVVCEIVEGDMILVHFESGFYYSVKGAGANMCALMRAGLSLRTVAERISQLYGIERAHAERDVLAFADRLRGEGLVVAAADNKPISTLGPLASGEYKTPVFEKFDDLADQLLLDKIEDETKEAVWQSPKVDQTSSGS